MYILSFSFSLKFFIFSLSTIKKWQFSNYIVVVNERYVEYTVISTYIHTYASWKKIVALDFAVKTIMIHARSHIFIKWVVLCCAESNKWDNVTKCQSDLCTCTIRSLNFRYTTTAKSARYEIISENWHCTKKCLFSQWKCQIT